MANLRKFTLEHNGKKGGWDLQKKGGQTIKHFLTKADATKGRVIEKALGKEGGSVSIRKMNGRIQEERTYPRSRDPKGSPG